MATTTTTTTTTPAKTTWHVASALKILQIVVTDICTGLIIEVREFVKVTRFTLPNLSALTITPRLTYGGTQRQA